MWLFRNWAQTASILFNTNGQFCALLLCAKLYVNLKNWLSCSGESRILQQFRLLFWTVRQTKCAPIQNPRLIKTTGIDRQIGAIAAKKALCSLSFPQRSAVCTCVVFNGTQLLSVASHCSLIRIYCRISTRRESPILRNNKSAVIECRWWRASLRYIPGKKRKA